MNHPLISPARIVSINHLVRSSRICSRNYVLRRHRLAILHFVGIWYKFWNGTISRILGWCLVYGFHCHTELFYVFLKLLTILAVWVTFVRPYFCVCFGTRDVLLRDKSNSWFRLIASVAACVRANFGPGISHCVSTDICLYSQLLTFI